MQNSPSFIARLRARTAQKNILVGGVRLGAYARVLRRKGCELARLLEKSERANPVDLRTLALTVPTRSGRIGRGCHLR